MTSRARSEVHVGELTIGSLGKLSHSASPFVTSRVRSEMHGGELTVDSIGKLSQLGLHLHDLQSEVRDAWWRVNC